MSPARRIGLGILLAGLGASRTTQAMDCPCTWEEVICRADAVAEIEMHLATKTTPDRMDVRRVIWNRTKQRVRSTYGLPNIPYVTNTRAELRGYLSDYLRTWPGPKDLAWIARVRRTLARGSYRSIIFLNYSPKWPWYGGGVAYNSDVNWLDHPRHAEWWSKVQPYLRERIEADRRGEKPAFCSRVSPAESQLKM
jgi:hypothetical protein